MDTLLNTLETVKSAFYPNAACLTHAAENDITHKNPTPPKWALQIVKNMKFEDKLFCWCHHEVKGSQPLYVFFCNSENWGNGGDTIDKYSNSLEYARKKANRAGDEFYLESHRKRAQKYDVPFKIITDGVWQVSLAPTDEELAAFLAKRIGFPFQEFLPVTNLVKSPCLREPLLRTTCGKEIPYDERTFGVFFKLGGVLR